MKNYLIFSLSFLFIFCIGTNTYSESQVSSSRKDSIPISAGASSLPFTNWQEQLNFAKQGGADSILLKNSLELVSYKKVRKDAKAVIESQFVETSWAVIPIEQKAIEDNFIIRRIGKNPILINLYNVRKKSILSTYTYDTLEVIQLNWRYKTKAFSTFGLVSTSLNSFIYDDLLSNVVVFSVIPNN